MPKPPATTPGAKAWSKILNLNIPRFSASLQYLQERSLPSLTEIIEFLERIQRSHPFIRQIAVWLYASFTGTDLRHLRRIQIIRFESDEKLGVAP